MEITEEEGCKALAENLKKWSFWSGKSWPKLQTHWKVQSASWGRNQVPTKLMSPSYLAWALPLRPKYICWWRETEEHQSQREKTLPPEKTPGANSLSKLTEDLHPSPTSEVQTARDRMLRFSLRLLSIIHMGIWACWDGQPLMASYSLRASLRKEHRSSSAS